MKNAFIVLGLGFGDEGKGVVVDYLCSKSQDPLVVRFSGGHQVGHTVKIGDKKHTFSNFGSGTLRNVPTLWMENCTVSPVGIINEFNTLKELDSNLNPQLYIEALCPVTTPFDIVANELDDNHHGTVGIGFGTTLQREEDHYHLFFQDLFHPTILRMKLKQIFNYYGEKITTDRKQWDREATFNRILKEYGWWDKINDLKELHEKNIHTVSNAIDFLFNYDDIIFEGNQGILLDQKHGFFPHVTRSSTTSELVLDTINEYMVHYNKVNFNAYYVSRIYQTRHGKGPMTNENLIPLKLINTTEEINIKNDYQGQFRKSVLDLDLINYALDVDNIFPLEYEVKRNLIFTCIDQISENFQYTQNSLLYNTRKLEEIVAKVLDIDDVYINISPESKTITLYKH